MANINWSVNKLIKLMNDNKKQKNKHDDTFNLSNINNAKNEI